MIATKTVLIRVFAATAAILFLPSSTPAQRLAKGA
jgi:hypothetical protein